MSAKARQPSPSSSESSLSSDTSSPPDSSSESSSDSSSGTSSSAASTARDEPSNRSQSRAGGATAPSGVVASGGDKWRVRQNPELRFLRPDNEFIPLPRVQVAAQVAATLQRVAGDKQLYPEGRYRTLDYFRAAVEMFVDTLRAEYKHQQQTAAKNGKTLNRFTWKNDGELAVCFACCCDWLKLLYGKLGPGPFKPLADDFTGQMKTLLIALSRVPVEVLPRKTYDTKFLDWEKGGTRYREAQSSANVRFPSAQDRRKKIEAYLSSSAGLRLEPTKVEPAAAAHPPPVAAPPVKSAAAPPFIAPFLPAKGPAPVPSASAAAAPPRAPLATKSAKARQAPARTASKVMPEPLRHLYWLSSLAHVKGGEPGAAFPVERIAALPGLVRLSETTVQPREVSVLVDVLAASCEAVQEAFERLGGLVAFRRLFGRVVKQTPAEGYRDIIRFVERVVQLKAHRWGLASQKAWRTSLAGVLMDDLGWLRTLPMIPVDRRAAWGALVLVMEEKFIFRIPREEAEESRKRSRLEAAAAPPGADAGEGGASPHMDRMRAAVADNVSLPQWKLPRVYTLGAVRLPAELRAPPLASDVEQDAVDFMNRRQLFAEETQEEWRTRLRAMLRVSAPGAAVHTVIPLWYDPFQLLGITPAE